MAYTYFRIRDGRAAAVGNPRANRGNEKPLSAKFARLDNAAEMLAAAMRSKFGRFTGARPRAVPN